jgi:predicted membrane-bound spermidine synthase
VKNKPVAPTAAAPSRALRRFLYFTAGVTGAAIMIVEILGAKMLAPFVGMSHFVWTAQIAVTLVALAVGYYAGGRLVDRSQAVGKLYWAIIGAAVYLALTVLICEPVAYWCLDFSLAVGSLLASSILFFIPLALLAMTGPFLARVITSSVAGVGSNVGRVTAIGTLGSFVGTLLIGYLLIPFCPNSVTMFLTALLLLLIAAAYFIGFQRKAALGLVAPMLITGISGWLLQGLLHHEYKAAAEIFRGNSHFGMLQVLRMTNGPYLYYLNDNLIQNTYDLERKQSVSQFTYVLSGLARAYATNIQDVLCIGLGVGIVPMDFAHHGAKVDVVEINPAVLPVAVHYFNFEPDKAHVVFDDARHFLNRCRKQYDVVILDAFLGDSSPSHLLTHEAFAAIRHVLRPGGVLTINAFGSVEAGRDFFAASLDKTLKTVFPGVRIHSNNQGAVFFAATDRPEPTFVHPPDIESVHPYVQRQAKTTFASVVEPIPDHGRVLMDNYNPAEFFDARNREEIRRRLALSVHDF